MRYFWPVILTICSFNISFSQNATPRLSEYSIQIWSTDQGLPSTNLRQVFQDKKGYIWISTFNGLIRFDGHAFDIFNSDIIPELKSNAFSVLAEDAWGSMYFGTQTSGLLKLHNSTFELFKIDNNFSKSITSILSDREGNVWVGAQDRGLYALDKKLNQYRKINEPLLDGTTINCIFQVKDGTLWFGTRKKGIITYDGQTFKTIEHQPPPYLEITCAREYNDYLYIATSDGVYRLKEDQWELIDGTEDHFINNMAFDTQGNLWVATETGLIRILVSGTVEYLTEEDGLPSRQISSLVLDSEGNVWLATKRSGLVLMRKSNFINISTKNGLSSPFVNIVYQLKGGKVLVGNDNGEVDQIEHNKISKMPIQTDLSNISIKDILQTRDGDIWLATYKGILRLHNGKEMLYDEHSVYIRCLFEDRSGNLWAGTKDAGLIKISKDGRIKVYNKSNGLSDNYIFSIDQLPNGNIIAGTYQGGLIIISADDTIVSKSIDGDKSSPLIFNVEVIGDEEYWLATDVGLFKYDKGEFFKIDKNAGLLVRTIFDVHQDNYGFLWITSNLGIVRVKVTSVNDFIIRETEQITARLYDERDGMLSRECTGATKMFVDETGNIWIPTSRGISVINPTNIHINEKIPPVYIKSILIDDKPVTDDLTNIVLEPGSQRLVINYTALSYYAPAKISFKYRLTGYEKEWNDVGNQYVATYMNLPDGTFTFEVKASNDDGFWNEVPAVVNVRVEPYFYKSRLFIVLMIGLFLLFAFAIYWIRIKVVEDKNKELHKLNTELDSFVYSVSHDLRAPLSSILGLINISKLDKDRSNIDVYLSKIESSVNKLDDFIKEIISYSRNVRLQVEVEEVDLKQMISDILEGLEYMNPNNSIKVTIEASENTILRSDKTRLQIIFNNIIANSFRYYKNYINNAYIHIKIDVNEERAKVVIEDNGIGIQPDRLKKIFDMFYRATDASNGSGLGLYIAKESMTKLEGTISVESEFERGTTFTLIFPQL